MPATEPVIARSNTLGGNDPSVATLSDDDWWKMLSLSDIDGAGIFYTGIGSRETPASVCLLMTNAASLLSQRGYRLRSGGANGADSAFEKGAASAKDIFLPYKGFNGNRSSLYTIDPACFELAAQVHGVWHRCSDFAKKAHARNTLQVLGKTLSEPSAFLICYTRDGARRESETSAATGGTRTAIVLADRCNVPILNLGFAPHLELLTAIAGDFHMVANRGADDALRLSIKAVVASLGKKKEDPVPEPKPETPTRRRGFDSLKRRVTPV